MRACIIFVAFSQGSPFWLAKLCSQFRNFTRYRATYRCKLAKRHAQGVACRLHELHQVRVRDFRHILPVDFENSVACLRGEEDGMQWGMSKRRVQPSDELR